MNSILYFFRTTEPFELSVLPWDKIHCLIVLITIVLAYLILKIKTNGKLLKTLFSYIFVVYNITYYTWYALTSYSGLRESLPLYSCRVCILLLALNFILRKKFFEDILMELGFLGCIVAFVYPMMDTFSFPHFTYLTFFIGHISLLLYSLLILKEGKYLINSRLLKRTIIFNSFICLISYLVNISVGANYNVMYKAPFFNAFFDKLPSLLYFVLAFLASNLVVVIMHYLLAVIDRIIKRDGF